MRSGFARLHPLVDLTFFVLVLAFAMFLSHPAVQLAGLVCAALFALRCTGRGFGRRMAMLLPLMLLAAVVNPLVSHQGVTVLFRFPFRKCLHAGVRALRHLRRRAARHGRALVHGVERRDDVR